MDQGGGGTYNDAGGRVILNDSSTVSGNTAGWGGGGIFNAGGRVVLSDSSTVSGNEARWGGGIVNQLTLSTLTLNGSSSVTENTAWEWGGGIAANGTLTLNDTASVTENMAEGWSGGIGIDPDPKYQGRIFICSDQVVISPNDPDDPPETQPCPS